MGLFDLFKKNPKSETKLTTEVYSQQNSDDELSILINADAAYKEDNDLEKVIKVYETVLDKCVWNTFNYQMNLAGYYKKAERYDDAWRILNKALEDSVKRGHGQADIGKIRMEQFNVLKTEKKYDKALVFLCYAFVSNNAPTGCWMQTGKWSRESFEKNAKVCIKKLGLTDDHLSDLTDIIEKAILSKDNSEVHIRDKVAVFLK